jgi:2,4-didehydro-3-deoxy-L-rhamnonate hydrolase
MKLYTYQKNNNTYLGAEKNSGLVNITEVVGSTDVIDLIVNENKLMPRVKDFVSKSTDVIEFTSVKIALPVKPSQVLCCGLNYKSHVQENPNAKFLDEPRFFAKLPGTVIGPSEAIRHPGEKFNVDYEVEFAVVFGKPAYRLTQKNAMDHVFGYTILHDVGARYIQFKDNNEIMGKNFETFCPIGPCIVTKDEIPFPEKCKLKLTLNGKIMQDGTNEDWCFTLPRLMEWLTMAFTMHPGDILSTGTPAGIGYFRNPQVFLKPGDVCELEVSGISKLVNKVIADEYIFHTKPNS